MQPAPGPTRLRRCAASRVAACSRCGGRPRRSVCPTSFRRLLSTHPFVAPVDDSFYFKPDAGAIMVSLSEETPSEPCDAYADDLDVAMALERFHAATIVPRARPIATWAGLRTFAPDRLPVVGFEPAVAGLLLVRGAGRHRHPDLAGAFGARRKAGPRPGARSGGGGDRRCLPLRPVHVGGGPDGCSMRLRHLFSIRKAGTLRGLDAEQAAEDSPRFFARTGMKSPSSCSRERQRSRPSSESAATSSCEAHRRRRRRRNDLGRGRGRGEGRKDARHPAARHHESLRPLARHPARNEGGGRGDRRRRAVAVDIGEVNGRYFVHHVTLGLHARMILLRERLDYASRLGKIWASCQAWWMACPQSAEPRRQHPRRREANSSGGRPPCSSPTIRSARGIFPTPTIRARACSGFTSRSRRAGRICSAWRCECSSADSRKPAARQLGGERGRYRARRADGERFGRRRDRVAGDAASLPAAPRRPEGS